MHISSLFINQYINMKLHVLLEQTLTAIPSIYITHMVNEYKYYSVVGINHT